jgi:transposase
LFLQATTKTVWAPIGETSVVQADPGRAKTHFSGTLNLRTGQEVVTRSDRMTSETTAAHGRKLLEIYPEGPILLLWDRAPWHKGAAVREVLAANPRLEVVSFPVASPELNPQEQVGKAARQWVSHNHTLKQLSVLADQFEDYLTAQTFKSSFLDKYGFSFFLRFIRMGRTAVRPDIIHSTYPCPPTPHNNGKRASDDGVVDSIGYSHGQIL